MFLKVNLNVWQLAMTCFKYHVDLYDSEAITYLNIILGVVTKPGHYESSDCPHPPTTGSPRPLCMAAEPSPIWKRTLVRLNYRTYVKSKEKNCVVEELSHVKQLSLNDVCKIGLKSILLYFLKGTSNVIRNEELQ